MREKLIELICSTEYGNSSLIGNNFQKGFIEKITDHIISSGFIEELQNEAYDLGVDSALHNHFGLSWEDAAGLRKEVTRLQNATKWIPVTERLPDVEGEYITYTDRGEIHFDCFCIYPNHGTKFWVRGNGKVTHWMEKPQPPKGE